METKNEDVNKVNKEHKYRVNLYLGKDLYAELSRVAEFLKIPLSTATRILLETGLAISTALEKNVVEGINNGKSKD